MCAVSGGITTGVVLLRVACAAVAAVAGGVGEDGTSSTMARTAGAGTYDRAAQSILVITAVVGGGAAVEP